MKDINRFFKSILLFIPFSVSVYLVFIVIAGTIPFQFLKPNINYRIGSYGHMYIFRRYPASDSDDTLPVLRFDF